ncbi:MAG TPA: agmatinase [Methanoculleus sp.]|nr:agmatinase [Methanoculleus sp.]
MPFFSHTSFADADSSYEDARYVLFGVPYDGTTSFRAGTRDGPRAIRDVSYNFETYIADIGIDLAGVPMADMGDIEPWCLPEDVVAQVRTAASQLHRDGKVPIMLGGEHSVTVGAVQALKPDAFVVADAHLDLRTEYGNTPFNHACVTRRVAEAGVDEVFIVGARSGTEEEYACARDLHLYSAGDVRSKGIGAVIDDITTAVDGRTVYLSIDADAIDCCLTPGLGTPEPFGITHWDVRDLVRALAPRAIGFDYVEVCPVDAGQTAAVAARIIRDFIASHWKATGTST